MNEILRALREIANADLDRIVAENPDLFQWVTDDDFMYASEVVIYQSPTLTIAVQWRE